MGQIMEFSNEYSGVHETTYNNREHLFIADKAA
jgi:hypothetical protein